MLIITGTGRSGTSYVSAVLSLAGCPCGHETMFTQFYPDNECPPLPAEASWLAVPFIKPEDKVVHLIRHPLKVIASMAAKLHVKPGDDSYWKFIYKHTGIEFTTYVDFRAKFFVEWTKRVIARRDRVIKIERFGRNEVAMLGRMAGIPLRAYKIHRALQIIPKTLNTVPHSDLTWRTLRGATDAATFAAVQQIAKDHGYDYE